MFVIVCVVLGALAWRGGFSPFELWWLAWVRPLALVLAARRARSAWRFALLVFGVEGLAWAHLQWWMIDVTALGLPAFVLYLAAWSALPAFLLQHLLRARRGGARASAIVVAPIVLLGLEHLRAYGLFDGYPWYLTGHALITRPELIQVADLGGATLVGLVVVLPAALIAEAIDARRARSRMVAIGSALAVLASAWGYGAWRIAQTEAHLVDGPRILALQTNLPQNNKMSWTREQQELDVRGFLLESATALEMERTAGRRVDLLAWPETMLPSIGFERGDRFSESVELFARSRDVPMLVGCAPYLGLREDAADPRGWTWDAHHNSAYLVQGERPYTRADKLFLTPFGETMPYISAWPWLEERLLALGAAGMRFDLDTGERVVRPVLRWTDDDGEARETPFATPICFEDTVAPVVRRMVLEGDERPARLIVNISNDGWFGADDAGRAAHARAAQLRCVELRVPMVRVANTGHTIAVDSLGRVVAVIAEGPLGAPRATGTLVALTRLDDRRTIYASFGEWPGWLAAIAVPLVLLSARRRRTRVVSTPGSSR